MSKLEALLPNSTVKGILPDSLVTMVNVHWFGSTALELSYKTTTGEVANELLYSHDEPRVEIVELGRPWSFDGTNPAGTPVRPGLSRAHIPCGAASAPDHGGL